MYSSLYKARFVIRTKGWVKILVSQDAKVIEWTGWLEVVQSCFHSPRSLSNHEGAPGFGRIPSLID